MEQTQILENQKVHQAQDEHFQENKDQQQQLQNQLSIKEAEFKMQNQKGQKTVVKLMMKKDFMLIQAVCCNYFWKIELGLDQASKMHVIFLINQSVEELFSHTLECFKAKQVSIEAVDEQIHLHFTQILGIREIKFTITLKQAEVNLHQIIQDLSEQVVQLEEQNQKYQEKMVLLEEEVQKLRIQPISRIMQYDEKELVYQWVSNGKVVSHLNLLYRASAHGFQASVYNWRCDGKGPLVCFVQSQNKRRFGGYIHMKYQKDQSKYVAANPNQSFLFSLDDKKQYLSNETSNSSAYYSSNSYGFTMGGGHDLYLSDNCHINNSSYSSLSHSYGKNQGGNNTSLAGSSSFVVDEIEVFEVIYKE